MGIKAILKLVEIQTKVASVIPFAAGTLYALFRYRRFNPLNFFLMFGSLLAVDMFTTTLNNYMDYKRAVKRSGYGYEKHNAIVSFGIPESVVIAVLVVLFSAAVFCGTILFLRTSIIVLIFGVLSFLTGILYSAGPVPLSRTPAGEFISGGFMGIVIPFLAIIIHLDPGYLFAADAVNAELTLVFKWKELVFVFLFAMPFFGGIANIMLANNICDSEDDLENRRYTLPVLIGTKPGLALFAAFYVSGYASVLLLIIFKVFPWWFAAYSLTLIPLVINVSVFIRKQDKATTFVLSVKNFIIQGMAVCAMMAIGLAF